MSQGGLVKMADILPPLPPGDPGIGLGWPVTAVLVVAALVFAWRWWRHPLRRLARDLARGCVSPRDAAHRLARRLERDVTLRGELDRVRFRRQPPSAATVSSLIRRAGDGR